MPPGPDSWRDLLLEMKSGRPHQYQRISRRMLNHLCSIGLKEAQQMLSEIDQSPAADQLDRANVPEARVSIADSALMSGAPFELADKYLGETEIRMRLAKWLYEDKASYFSTVVGDSRSSMPEIVAAIRHYDDFLRGRSGLAQFTLKSLRVSLIQRFLTEQIDFINVAKEVVRITDFIDLVDRVTMTTGCHGKLGGKSAGLLLARWILQQDGVRIDGIGQVKSPRTWYVISDAVMDFVKLNNLDDVMDQKFKDVTQVRNDYPNIIQLFKNSTFPPEVVAGLSNALDYFGEVPLVIRSSSLLEDRFGTSFSGKYKSLFVANQGTKGERLDALLDAVAEVWASVLGPDPIEYRRERGLQEFVEEMGILIQEVVGTRVGPYWMPAFAGVAFSNNEFRWSPRIQREDGLVRLVPGLGTRAVDRVGDDFPVLAVPGQPALRANATVQEAVRYSPVYADVINLETNSFETVRLDHLIAQVEGEYPFLEKIFSVYAEGRLRPVSPLLLDHEEDDLVADMGGLIGSTGLVDGIGIMLKTLQEYLGTPVDIEFAHDGKDFYLLQCRPQAQSPDSQPAEIPHSIPPENFIFSASRYVSNGWVPDISHIVLVDPERYATLPTAKQMRRVGRAVGRLNTILPKRRFILMGPGRWGSRGDIKLGVPVTYADINNTSVLIEIAMRRGDYLPDLSFGTHFFQDLVEASIRYLPLYPDEENVVFNREFLLESPNSLAEIIPEYADLADCVRVIDIPALRDGQILRLLMNAEAEQAVGILATADDDQETMPKEITTSSRLSEPGSHWRWRLRMAEKIALTVDASGLGVEAIYLYGSVKNGTARPDSDLNLLIHFTGDDEQRMRLEAWLAGWGAALCEMNHARTGVRVPSILDAVLLSDAEISAGTGRGALIGTATNAPRQLPLGGSDGV